jgi:DNA-binding MarR family transcriptional regulator
MPQHKPRQQPHSVQTLHAHLEANWPEQAGRIRPQAILLYRARDLLLDDLAQVLAPYDMQPADLDVLAALRIRALPHQLTPTELYRALLISSGGLTKILHRLEAAGWIDRPANPTDGRSRLVRLTRRGKAQVEQVIEVVVAHEERCLAPLDAAEQAELERLLDKLLSGQLS